MFSTEVPQEKTEQNAFFIFSGFFIEFWLPVKPIPGEKGNLVKNTTSYGKLMQVQWKIFGTVVLVGRGGVRNFNPWVQDSAGI